MNDNRHRLLHVIVEAVRPKVVYSFHATDLDMSHDGNVCVGSMLTFDAVDLEKVRLYDVLAGDCIGTLRLSLDGSDFRFIANTTCVGLAPSELKGLEDLLRTAWEKEMAIKKELERNA